MEMRSIYKIFLFVFLILITANPLFALQQDNFIIVKSIVANRIIDPALIALYQDDTLYLPFDYLTDDLDLVLKYDKQAHIINGWLEEESNKVLIDFNKEEGQVGKNMFAVSEQDFIYYEDDLYLSTKLIDNILRSSTEFDFSTQTITMQTIGNLPFEKELSRKEKRDKFDRLSKEKERKRQEDLNKQIYKQNDLLQYPFIDLSAKYSIYDTPEGGSDSNFGYSVNAALLTGGFDTNAYLYSSTDKEPPILALKTSKIDEDGQILGLFKQLEIGDIYSYSSTENLGAQSGWGIKMSTDSAFNTDGKTYNIRSELPLGWEVELYRNGEMLGYQNSSNDGFFEFTGIPLLLGKNVFKFVFYGPQGQIKEKYDILFFNGNILDKGKTRVKLDYINKNRYLVEFRDKPRETSLGHHGLAEFGYGITDNLTLNLSAIADSLEYPAPYPPGTYTRDDKAFASAELSLFSFGIYSSLSTIADFKENAFTLDYYGQTSLLDWDIIFENIYFGNAITSRNIYNDTYIENQTTLRLSKNLKLGALGFFPFSYYLSHFSTISNQDQTEHYVSLSKNLPYNFYVNATYQNSYYISANRTENLGLNINKIYGPYTIRANSLYNLTYDVMQNAEISAYRNLTPQLKAGVKYAYTARNLSNKNYESLYSANLNWSTKIGFFSFEIGTSSWHNNYAFIGYNLSLLPDKRNGKVHTSATKLQGTGAISARAFMDNNMNGLYDPDETILHEAEFDLTPKVNIFDSKKEIEKGGKVLTHIPAYKPVDIALNVDNVHETLSLLSTTGDKTVMLRPAQIVYLDFPVVGTGDIEGSVFIQNSKGRREARGIILKLYNADTKELLSSKISEYDGYYIFQQLPMGNYQIAIDEAQSKDLDLVQDNELKVVLNKFEQLEIINIVLRQIEIKEEGEEEEESNEEVYLPETPVEPAFAMPNKQKATKAVSQVTPSTTIKATSAKSKKGKDQTGVDKAKAVISDTKSLFWYYWNLIKEYINTKMQDF